MDSNKLKVLQDVGYVVRKVCGNCEHSLFVDQREFGTCSIQTYHHLKHSDSNRQLSVNRYGVCPLHKWHEYFKLRIHSYALLMEKE